MTEYEKLRLTRNQYCLYRWLSVYFFDDKNTLDEPLNPEMEYVFEDSLLNSVLTKIFSIQVSEQDLSLCKTYRDIVILIESKGAVYQNIHTKNIRIKEAKAATKEEDKHLYKLLMLLFPLSIILGYRIFQAIRVS